MPETPQNNADAGVYSWHSDEGGAPVPTQPTPVAALAVKLDGAEDALQGCPEDALQGCPDCHLQAQSPTTTAIIALPAACYVLPHVPCPMYCPCPPSRMLCTAPLWWTPAYPIMAYTSSISMETAWHTPHDDMHGISMDPALVVILTEHRSGAAATLKTILRLLWRC